MQDWGQGGFVAVVLTWEVAKQHTVIHSLIFLVGMGERTEGS